MLEIRKIVKFEYAGTKIPAQLKDMLIQLKEKLSSKFNLDIKYDEMAYESSNNEAILLNAKEIEIRLASDETWRIYKLKIKYRNIIPSEEIEQIVEQSIPVFSIQELIEKVDKDQKMDKQALSVLGEASINKDQFDQDIFSVFKRAFADPDKDVRIEVSWCIYSSPAYWMSGIPLIISLIKKDDEDLVKTAAKSALRMIVKEFIDEIVNPVYTGEVWDNAFYVNSENPDSIIDAVIAKEGGFDEILEEVLINGFSSSNPDVRINSAWCIHDLGLNYKKEFWQKLEGFLKAKKEEESDEDVRANIVMVLDNIQKQQS